MYACRVHRNATEKHWKHPEILHLKQKLVDNGVRHYSGKIRWMEAEVRQVETGVSSAGKQVSKKKFRYFHIRTAGASAKTESFIGDYCWRLMESDNTTTQAGKRGGRQEPQFSFQNSNCKANNLFPHDLFSTLCFCACTHLREMHFLKWLF